MSLAQDVAELEAENAELHAENARLRKEAGPRPEPLRDRGVATMVLEELLTAKRLNPSEKRAIATAIAFMSVAAFREAG